MKVKDLLELELSVDVYDNVCEELGIAFESPVTLTESGKKHFADALELDVYAFRDSEIVIDVDDEDDSVFEKKLSCAKEFFESAAGFCSVSEYNEWFA